MTPGCRLSTLFFAPLLVSGLLAARAQDVGPAIPLPPGSLPRIAKGTPPAVSAKSDYAREPSVIERLDVVYRYAADGTGSREMSAVIHIQDEAAIKTWGVLGFPFASSAEHVEIDYVRVRRAGDVLISTPATDAQELPAPITREAPFYSDLKEKQVPVRSVRAGDRVEYKVRIVRTKPEAPGHFWGEQSMFTPANGVVVLQQTVELHVPKGAAVTVWSPTVKQEQSDTATERVYTWHSAQLHPIAGVEKTELQRLVAAERDADDDGETGRLAQIAWTNFHDWAEVGAWYRGMEGSRMMPDDEIRAKVAELIAGKATAEEKVRAIYGFVAPQVRYIGVAFGIGRYQPHEAGDVLRNQYGDCKDKHTLLAAMLAAAGFTADAALIGAGVRFNDAVPSPGAFNHVITVVQMDGKPVWLDATAEVAPYRMLMPVLRDKQALLVPAAGLAHVERTPKDLPFKPEIHFEADGSLDEQGTSHSHFTMVMRGDEEVLYRQAVHSVSPSQWDELMQNISRSMSYAGKVTHAEFSRPEDTAEPFHVSYDYEREKNGDWDNRRILAQLPPAGLVTLDEKDPPTVAIALGTPHVEVDHAVMKLPPGWGAELPAAVHAKSAYATLDKTYKVQDGKLITDRRVEVLQQKVPATEWRTYQKFATDAGLDGEPFIQLHRGGGSHNAALDDPAAAGLIREVVSLEQERNFTGAAEKLDKAKAINPKQAYLWSNYGWLAMMNGKPNEAVDDLKRELADHPDEANVYMLLVQAQVQQRKPDQAIGTLEKLVTLKPEDENASLMLANMQIGQKQFPAAEKTLRSNLAAHPDANRARLLLGTTLIREGRKGEAETLLKGLLEGDDAMILNDAAYSLADEDLDTPMAEKAARRSVSLLEAEVAAAQADESDPKAAIRAETLTNVWNTLGWALFREGKVAEAEPWVRAAWENSLAAEPGYHLGQILEKQGKPAQAMALYQVSLYGDKASSDTVAQGNIARQAALRKAGTPSQVADGKNALQGERTFKVPGANTVTAWATVQLMLDSKGVTSATVFKTKDAYETSKLEPMMQSLRGMDLKATVPPESKAKMTRLGVLSCHAGSACELVLLSTRAALSEHD